MKGKLIVIDGLDGSGKSTQTELLLNELQNLEEKVILVSYPNYKSESSALVKMYLNGEFSNNPDDINAYAASSFYAVDRYATFMKEWKKYYDEGYTILLSRYVSSNEIHQMAKLDENEWDRFLNWIYDYEYEKMGIPKPDKIIFLDMPQDLADRLLSQRYEGNDDKKDIHEKNMGYLRRCRKAAMYAAEKEKWDIVNCAVDGNIKTKEEITKEIMDKLRK